MEMVQMNTRIGTELKRAGDDVLRRNGYSPTSAVKALWTYVCEHNALPSFMPVRVTPDEKAEQMAAIQREQGMAWRLFGDLTGIECALPSDDDPSYEELREWGWEEKGAFDD